LKDLPAGRNTVELHGRGDAAEAKKLIGESLQRFRQRPTP
jgi:inorganic pyrophosphatase